MALSQALLPEFDHEFAGTRKSLERVPEDKFGWKPHPKSYSMGELATHLAVWADRARWHQSSSRACARIPGRSRPCSPRS